MAITTQDQLVSSYPGQTEPYYKTALGGTFAAGDIISLWTAAGNPGAGITPAGGLTAAVPDFNLAGACIFTNPSAGNTYIPKLFASSSVIGTLILYDRLVHCAGITAASTSGSFTSFTVSRRDASGTAPELFMECYTANTATAPAIILTYTNQAGTGSKVAGTVTGAAAMSVGLMNPVPLAGGDTGVRSVQSYTKAATTGGGFGVTMMRRLALIPCALAQVAATFDNFMLGMPQVYNSACVAAAFQIGSGTACPNVNAQFSLVQG